jgi:hypothetical protein
LDLKVAPITVGDAFLAISSFSSCDFDNSPPRTEFEIPHRKYRSPYRLNVTVARVAQPGAWVGGIVPYGYRKAGQRSPSRLVIAEDPIPNLALSEAEVIRTVFRRAAIEKESFSSSRIPEPDRRALRVRLRSPNGRPWQAQVAYRRVVAARLRAQSARQHDCGARKSRSY